MMRSRTRTTSLGDTIRYWRLSPTVRVELSTTCGGVALVPPRYKVIQAIDAPGAREAIVSTHRLLTAAVKAARRIR